MFSKLRSGLVLAVLLLAGVSAARADYAVLASGHRLRITAHETDGDKVRLYLASGGYADVPQALVVGYEVEEALPPAESENPTVERRLIQEAAGHHGLDAALVESVVAVESNFNPRAISGKGAMGLMQLMPATADRLAVRNVFDPVENLEAGVRYLRELLDRFGNSLPLALAAYNAGPQRVILYGGIPPYPETRSYVRRVMERARRAPLAMGREGDAAFAIPPPFQNFSTQ